MAISFKGTQYQKSVILFAVFFYLRYPVSYRDLEKIMAKRGVKVDHATLNRWVVKYAPLLAGRAQVCKRVAGKRWISCCRNAETCLLPAVSSERPLPATTLRTGR